MRTELQIPNWFVDDYFAVKNRKRRRVQKIESGANRGLRVVRSAEDLHKPANTNEIDLLKRKFEKMAA